MYLFDTNIISNLMRRTPSAALLERLTNVRSADQFVASTTLGELVYGAERDPSTRTARLRRIDELVSGQAAVLPFDEDAARRYGPLRAGLERVGQRLEDHDLEIASIALARDLTVVTANTRHFERVPGLRVENWL